MKEMDRILKNKIYDHASELPSDMWSKIEYELKEERRKKFGFWYFLFGLGILLVLSGSWFYLQTEKQQKTPVSTLSLEGPPEIRTSTNDALLGDKTVSISNAPSNQEHSHNLSSKVGLDQEVYTSGIEANTSNLEVNAELDISQNSRNSFDKNKITRERSPSDESRKYLAEELDTPVQENKLSMSHTDDNIDILDIEKLSINELNIPLKDFKDPVGCPTFSQRAPLNLFAEVHYSPLLASKFLASNSPEIGEEYINLRRNSERALYSWSAGANIGWISNLNVGLKAGVHYEVINERFSYQDPEAIRNQTVITIDTIFNQDGSLTINSDTSVIQVIGTETLQIHNYHRSVEIPLHFLYYLDMDALDFEISGGPNLNINYSNRGKIVDPSNDDRWFTNGQNENYNVFRDRLGLSLSLTVSALYNVNEKVQVYARPNFKYNLTSMARDNSPFKQRYLTSGLAVGARYYFSGNPYF